MQNAKDTFFEVLRGRLVALNPERTVVVRGAVRPGVLVDENEMAGTAALPDCFHLRWGTGVLDGQGAMPMVTLSCEVCYGTAGTAINGGLDRGRMLAAMDGELLAAVRLCPQNCLKSDYRALADGGAAVPMTTRVWWGDPVLGAVTVDRDRIMRAVTIAVMSYEEAGEL